MEDEDDRIRGIVKRDLDMQAFRTLQLWVKDNAMRYEAMGLPCGEHLITTMIRVLVTTLGRAKMPKADFVELMSRAYDCFEQERKEGRHATDW